MANTINVEIQDVFEFRTKNECSFVECNRKATHQVTVTLPKYTGNLALLLCDVCTENLEETHTLSA